MTPEIITCVPLGTYPAPPQPRFVSRASEDHKPDRDDEHARISAAGGFVSDADAARRSAGGLSNVVARLDGNLAVSRGLGDFAYKRDSRRAPKEQKVSCVPEFYRLGGDGAPEVLEGDIVVLACDGIFDVMTNEALARAILLAMDRGDDLGDIAANIVTTCLRELNSKDNMTLMIVEAGVDGSDYAYIPTQTTEGQEDGDESVDARRADDSLATADDDRATDEIVGIDQYERQQAHRRLCIARFANVTHYLEIVQVRRSRQALLHRLSRVLRK